jgi:hypothetical protein
MTQGASHGNNLQTEGENKMNRQGKKTRTLWVGLTLIIGLAVLTGTAAATSTTPAGIERGTVINFEGLAAGTIVDSVSAGKGMSGDVVSGFVKVFGFSDVTGIDTNAAMVFDSACPPDNMPASCTGKDRDLFKPELGKVLIVSEDLDSTDPDDADFPSATLEFDFSAWGSGTATVDSLTVMDIEEAQNHGDALIELYSGGENGTLLGTVPLPDTGNNGMATVNVGMSGVDFMRIKLNGSGAVDNIKIHPEEVLYLSNVDVFNDGKSSLYRVDIDEIQAKAILTLLPNGVVAYDNVDTLACTPDGSRLYMVDDVIENTPEPFATLAYYDVASGLVQEVGKITIDGQNLFKIDQAAFAPDGTLYITGTITDSLYRLDPENGKATLIGEVINSATNKTVNIAGGDIAITSDGEMFMWTSSGRPGSPAGLYQVPLSPENGVLKATFISVSPNDYPTYRGMAVRGSGTGDLVRARFKELHIFSRDGKDVIGPFPLILDGQVYAMGGGDMSIGPFAP